MRAGHGLIHPDDIAQVQESIALSARTMQPWHAEFRVRNPVRGELWVEGHSVPRREADGGILWHGFVHDITQRKRAEEALRVSEARLRQAAEAAQTGTWDQDLKANTLFLSPSLEKLMGYEPGTFPGTPGAFLELLHPDSIEAHVTAQQQARKGDGFFQAELHFRLRDGEERWGLVRGQMLLDAQGEPCRMVGTHIEITERKLSEIALRASEERFRAVVESAPDGICLQAEGRFVYVNGPAARMFGAASPSDLLGRSFLERFHPDDRLRVQQWIRVLNEERRPVPLARERYVRLDGAVFDAEVTAAPFDHQGRHGALIFFRDVTDRKRLEDQLRQAQKMEGVGQLAGGIAHDFNNILTAMMMQLELLQAHSKQSVELCDGLGELMTQAQRAASLTRQLLLFSRRSVMHVEPLSLNDVVENLLKMLRRLIGENIKLDWHGASQLPPIPADAGMLEQLLMNLVVNARDAMPKGGRIVIGTEALVLDPLDTQSHPQARPGSFVCLSVADTGCGMDEITQSRIFEPFFTTKEEGKGTGLGLATVYGIVSQHNGWISVQSKVAHGTVFRVFLPASNVRASHPMTTAAEPVRGGSETILLVEDDLAVRRTVGTFLRRWGYHVLEASNGLEAAQVWQARATEIDLLYTDMIMPEGITGVELAESLRSSRPDLKVIISSGYSTELAYHSASLLVGVNYVAKPCSPADLAAKVRECLDACAPAIQP
ncbi:MAG: PAS domain S-box protein [Verrucomicrobiota bacterium]